MGLSYRSYQFACAQRYVGVFLPFFFLNVVPEEGTEYNFYFIVLLLDLHILQYAGVSHLCINNMHALNVWYH